ncbi:uncharacterized protein LOC135809266 isoform X2 [Sycon ciliatum]|uniref:uncharacterized protein LOC135809266 isoform X2 n=1 Tax=Sycon ciliatum TaxID=27933 RepID=UPI0031F72123
MRILGGCDVFAYDNAHGMLATGGYDGHIRLWRPFHSPEPICIMKGHIKPVIQLLMLTNPADFLLSLCRDAVIRVWDMLGHSCIQVLQAFPLVKDDFYNCLMLHDTIHDRLVFSFDEKMYHVRLAGPRDLGPRSHAATVTGCVYKQSTEQLITAAWDSSISFWAISSGQRVHKGVVVFQILTCMQMEGCHRKAAITSLALSVNEKFLISGGDDRIIKVWDVSTYGIVHAFDPEHCVCGGAVNSLIAMQGKVIAVGWARFLTQYEVNSCSSFVIHPTFLDSANGHNTYICRAVVVSKAHIVTVSFNLEIIVWNLRTGAVVSRINCMSESSQRVRHTSQHGRKDNVQGKIRTGPATLLKMFPFSVHTTSKGVASNMSMPNSLSTAQEIYEGDQSAKVRSRGTAQSRATAQRGRASAFRRQPRVPRRPLILQDPKDRLTMAGLRGSPRRSDQLSKGQRRLVQNISEREYMLDAEAMGKVGSNDGHYCSSKQHIDAFRVCCAIYLEGRKGTHANLVTSGHDRHVYFWNLITGRCQTKFCPFPEVGGNGFVLCAGSPVGRYLATANDNGDVILWSLHQYATVKKLSDLFSRPHTEDVAPKRHVAWRAHGEEISSLLFVRHIYSPLLVTASVSGVVGLWNVSGESIGLFGQKLHWDLEKRVTATYKRTLAYARGNVRELSPSNRKAYTVTLKPASGTFRSDYTDQQNKHVTSAANGRFPSGPKLAFGNAGSSDANTTSANDRKKQQPSNQKSTANGVSKPSSDRTKACGTERQPVCAGQQSSSAKQPSTAEKPSTRNRSGQPPTVGQQSSPGNRRPSAASIPVSPASHTQSSSHSSHAHQHQPTGQRSADNIQIQDGGKQSRGLGTKPQPDNRRLPATGVTRKASSSLLRSSDGGHPTYKQNQMFRARRQSVLKETPAVERLSSVQRSQSSMEPISDAQKLLVYVGSKSAMARRSYEKSPEKDQTPCLTIDRLTVHDDRLSTERSRTSSLPLAMQVTMRSGIGMVWNDEIPTTQAVDDLYCGYDLPSCEEAKVDVAVQHTPTQRQAARLKWENEGFKESADQLLNHERRTYRKNSRRRSRRRSSSGIPKEDDPLYRESDVFSDASDESLFSASPRAASRQHAAAGAGIIEMRDGDGTFRSIDQESFRSLSRGSDAPIAHRVNNTQPQQDPVPLVSMAAKHTQDPSTASSSFTRTVATVSSGFDHDTLNKHHPGKRRSKPPSLQTRVYEEDSDEPQEAFWDRDSDSE